MNALCEHCGELTRTAKARFCSHRCVGLANEAAKRARKEPDQRFWASIDRRRPDECWHWLAGTNLGYGQIRYYGRKVGAHVLSFELRHGPVPVGKMVLHRCGNRLCCNPAHLYAGTHANNTNDALRHGTFKCNFGRGDGHICARLREADIPIIRQALKDGESQRALGRRFGVSQQAISHVAHGNTWKHVA